MKATSCGWRSWEICPIIEVCFECFQYFAVDTFFSDGADTADPNRKKWNYIKFYSTDHFVCRWMCSLCSLKQLCETDRKRDILVFNMVASPWDGTNTPWRTVTAPIPHPRPRGLWGPNSSRQTRHQLGYSWFLVRGWDWGQEAQEGEGPRDKEREKLAGRFWKAVTFPMMSAFPITALTPDPGRWFNGGILFLLTSPFFPPIKTENTRAGTEAVWEVWPSS